MKKLFSFFAVVAICFQLFAETTDYPSFPSNTRLRVVGSNVNNYLSDFEASNASCKSQAVFDDKTDKMATVFVGLQADIVALCEVQEDDYILDYIVDAMNKKVGSNVYDKVMDGATYNNPAPGEYGNIKSGYIFRCDKLTEGIPESTNKNDKTFRYRMQVVTFTERATKEKFVLSVNHFKAYTEGASQRKVQATRLTEALKKNYGDPDILIVGDLNAEVSEESVNSIITAGYEEQLLKYDSKAYTYVYKGQRELIDHAMANSSMASQITGAYVYHIPSSVDYSDHDCYVVGINLGGTDIDEVTANTTVPQRKLVYRNGQILIQLDETFYDMMGRKIE